MLHCTCMLFYMHCVQHGMALVLFHSQTPFPTFPYCMLKEPPTNLFSMQYGKSVGDNRPEVGLEMGLPGFIKSMYLRLLLFSCYVQRIEGCVCINPGRLTKKASGGTFVKVFVPDAPTIKDDFSSDITVQIVYIWENYHDIIVLKLIIVHHAFVQINFVVVVMRMRTNARADNYFRFH